MGGLLIYGNGEIKPGRHVTAETVCWRRYAIKRESIVYKNATHDCAHMSLYVSFFVTSGCKVTDVVQSKFLSASLDVLVSLQSFKTYSRIQISPLRYSECDDQLHAPHEFCQRNFLLYSIRIAFVVTHPDPPLFRVR